MRNRIQLFTNSTPPPLRISDYPTVRYDHQTGNVSVAPKPAWFIVWTETGDDYTISWNGDKYSEDLAHSGEKYEYDPAEFVSARNLFKNNRKINATSPYQMDLNSFDTSNVENMSYMFYGCSSLTSLDVSNFNTSNVENMSYMFYNCPSLTSLDLSSFDTSNVTNMSDMFQNCSGLTSLDVSNFDTSNVTDMGGMFDGCSSILEITCKSAFRDWCINNANDIYLPNPLRNTNSSQWHIVD